MRDLDLLENGRSDKDELKLDENTCVSYDPDWCEPISEPVDPLDDDDGLGDDLPSYCPSPYCPMDTLDTLELCGRLLDDLVNGKPVSRAKAVMATGQAVKCFEKYGYELQEWFFDARDAAKREVNEIGTGDTPRDPTADEGSGDRCDCEETTGA